MRRPKWAIAFKRKVKQQYGQHVIAAEAIGIPVASLHKYYAGIVPSADVQSRIRNAMGEVDFPPGVGQAFNDRLAELAAEQKRIYDETGQLRLYTMEEIGGDTISSSRVGQIDTYAKAKYIQRLMVRVPTIFYAMGFPEWVVDDLVNIFLSTETAEWYVNIVNRIVDKVTADKRRRRPA